MIRIELDEATLARTRIARGAAAVAGERAPMPEHDSDRLALLLGKGRAMILRSLATPSTTASLAATLGLAPSTVSEHLSVLVEAGVAGRRRAGRHVVYGLETAGLALVSLIAPASAEERSATVV